MTIRRLDSLTISQIAAGEVVANPASVLKELIENSLDAGSSRIAVTLEAGGRTLVEVVDDGSGLAAAVMPVAFERHATSKISATADLETVSTLGFRGEALPSIASVSRMEMVSRPRESDQGWMLKLTAGEIVDQGPAPHPGGTTVRVRDLFFNTPARGAQLRDASRELTACLRAATALALSRPDVAMAVNHGQRLRLETTGSGDLAAAYMQLFGRDQSRDMVPVEASTAAGFKLRGLVGRPSLARGSRARQIVLVNGRAVKLPVVLRALTDALRPHLGDGGHVPAVLALQIDGKLVDVNVHPAKSEVRLSREADVYRLVRGAVGSALGTAPVATRRLGTSGPLVQKPRWEADEATQQEAILAERAPARESAAVALGSIFDTYVVVADGRRAYLVDQHAAHERIVYDELQAQWEQGGVPTQSLLEPQRLELAPADFEFFEQNAPLFAELGYEVQPFGGNSLLVRGVPHGSSAAELGELVDVLQERRGDSVTRRQRALLHLAACRSAVMAGQRLKAPELERLLTRLEATTEPWTCPHGRPTRVELAREEVERWFRRR